MAALLCLQQTIAHGQQSLASQLYNVRRWEAGATENGLPQNTITAVVQSGTAICGSGRTEGWRGSTVCAFTVFDNNNTPGLVSSRVTSLFEADDGTEGLSPREREVLALLARGYFYTEISEALKISISAVNTRVRRIYEKLHVHSCAQAVAKLADVQGHR